MKRAETTATSLAVERDSNPHAVARKLISSQPRYDHFDTAPRFISTPAPRKTGRTDGENKENNLVKDTRKTP